MAINKNLIAALATAGLIGVSASGATVLAATSSDTDTSSIVKRLAEKFNLDEAKVQEVFDTERWNHQQERKQKLTDRLDQAVKDGKITEDQKTKLLAKMEELRKSAPTDPQQRKTDRREHREELKKWATDNGIDLNSLGLGAGHGFGPLRGRH